MKAVIVDSVSAVISPLLGGNHTEGDVSVFLFSLILCSLSLCLHPGLQHHTSKLLKRSKKVNKNS